MQISLDHLDYPGEELLRLIGAKLIDVYETAYQMKFDRDLQTRNVDGLAASCASLLSTSHRRHFVKSLITMLTEQRVAGEHLYQDENLQGVLRDVTEQLGRTEVGEY